MTIDHTPEPRRVGEPLPPDYPKLLVHQSQWEAFELAGYDMRFFEVIKPIEITKLAASDAPRWPCPGVKVINVAHPEVTTHVVNTSARPLRKHISNKQCSGKEVPCLRGLGGHCVACANDD